MQQAKALPEYILSITPDEVVEILKGMGDVVRWLRRLRIDPNAKDKMKYYAFHNDHGHKMEECVALRLEVLELLKRGHLSTYSVTKPRSRHNKAHRNGGRRPDQLSVIEKSINCITDGSEISGINWATSKRHYREVQHTTTSIQTHELINFYSEDMVQLFHPHHNALVVTLLVSNYRVKRILSTTGVQPIFYSCIC